MDVREIVASIVRAVTSDLVYARVYAATVELQHDDGSCDVRPDAAELRGDGLQHVPVMVSPAGTGARVEPGTRCLVAFADGDPRQPRIVAWEYAQVRATVALDSGAAGVARNGDLVQLNLSPMAPVSGVASGTVTIPGSPPTVVALPPGAPFVGTATIATPVRGRILGGAARVKG